MDIITMALAVALDTIPVMGCPSAYHIPAAVTKVLSTQENVVVEIIEKGPLNGFIYRLNYNRVYFEGLFYLSGNSLIACDITFAILVAENTGELLFIYAWDQKDM